MFIRKHPVRGILKWTLGQSQNPGFSSEQCPGNNTRYPASNVYNAVSRGDVLKVSPGPFIFKEKNLSNYPYVTPENYAGITDLNMPDLTGDLT